MRQNIISTDFFLEIFLSGNVRTSDPIFYYFFFHLTLKEQIVERLCVLLHPAESIK